MFSKLIVSAAFAASALAQTFSINTPPSLVQCQAASITWVGGTSPYTLSAIPGGQSTAAAIEYIATGLTSSPYAWTVNLATGLNITLKINDNQGNIAYSSPLVIQSGPSSACLNASASTSGVSTGAVSSTAAASGSSAASAVVSSAASTTSAVASSASAVSNSATSAVSAASNSAASLASAASSVVASATSKAGAFQTAVAGLPALALAAVGGVVALF